MFFLFGMLVIRTCLLLCVACLLFCRVLVAQDIFLFLILCILGTNVYVSIRRSLHTPSRSAQYFKVKLTDPSC